MYFSVVLGLVFVVNNLKGAAGLGNRTCEIGWKKSPFTNDCYRFFPAALTWKNALNSCIGQNGMLAVVHNDRTNSYLTANVTGGYRAWLGLNDRDKPNHWNWAVTGKPTRYTNWAAGEPSDGIIFAEECVEVEDASGKWNDEACDSTRPYVCQRSLGCDTAQLRGLNTHNSSSNASLLAVGTQVSVDVRCGTGYRPVNDTALTTCQVDGTWSTENFHCTEIYCQTPTTKIPNARSAVDGNFPYLVGSKVLYSCKSGYALLGNDQSTCRDLSEKLKFGIWDQPPICVKAPNCDDGWTNLNYQCYKHVGDLLGWRDADKRCQAIGGTPLSRLASISNYFENELVKSLGENTTSVWIGFHDNAQEDVWEWSDGSSVRYKNFMANEPNNGQFWWDSEEDCVELDTASGEWNDEQCDAMREFVCEKPLGL